MSSDNLFDDLPDLAPATAPDSTATAAKPGGSGLFDDIPETRVLGGALAGTEAEFYKAGEKHGVDPRLLMSIAKFETGDGTSHMVRTKNNVAGITDHTGQTYRTFGSIDDSIDYMASNLRRNYLDKGLTTIPAIAQKYAPVGASNDPNATNNEWPTAVAQNYAKIGLSSGLSPDEIRKRMSEFPAIAGEVTGASAEAAGTGKGPPGGMGMFGDLPDATKPEGKQKGGSVPELKDSMFADLPQAAPQITPEPTAPPTSPAITEPGAEEEPPSLPTISLGAPSAAPQQSVVAPQIGPSAAPEEQQQPPTAAPPAPVAAGVSPAAPGFAPGADVTAEQAAQIPSLPSQVVAPPAPPQDVPSYFRAKAGVYAPQAVEMAPSQIDQESVPTKILNELGQKIQSMIPTTPSQAAGMATPVVSTVQDLIQTGSQLPAQWDNAIAGLQGRELPHPEIAPKTYDKFTKDDWIKFGVDVGTDTLMAVAGLRGFKESSSLRKQTRSAVAKTLKASPGSRPIQVASAREVPVPEEFQPKGATESEAASATTEPATEAAPILGGPGTPGAGEIPEARVTGLRNAIIDEERAKRGWLPLMRPARVAMGETWDQAMNVLERDQAAGSKMVNDIRDGRKKSVDAVDHAVLAHERIVVMNEAAMEAERASDLHMTEQERNEARARWGVMEDRLNEVDQALRQAGTITGRALQFRKALIRDDYTFEGLSRKARAIKGGPLTLEESAQIQKVADKIKEAEEAASTRQVKATEQAATEQANTELAATRSKVARTPKPANLDAQHTKLLTAMTEHVKEGGSLDGLRPLVQKLAENYVRRGITKLQPLTRALHETLKNIVPDITSTQVRDLFSGYGDFRPLNKDAIQVQLRDLRGQAQQAAKIKDMFEKQAPKKTGPERRTPTAHERQLTKLVNELKKKGGFTVTDPATQLKSALGAVKTRLKNQLEDLTRQLFTGERPVKKGGLEYDVETEKLRTLRDQVKQSLQDVTERPELTDAQRLAVATKAAERNLDYWTDRLKLAKQGVFKIDRETGKPISDPQLDAMRARIAAVKAEVDSLKKIANPLKTPEERALASYQARLFNRMADLQDRIAKGDFAARPRKPVVLDKETQELTAQAERLKRQFDQGVARKRLQDRGRLEKILDGISKWRRAFVLSWPTVLGKLTSASAYLMGVTPLEELARSPYRVLLPRVAEKAPAFGRGFHLQTEVGAITHTFKTLFSAVTRKFKTGHADIDVLYGDPKILPPELKDFVGNLHSALKEPARQNEFFRRFQNRLYAAGKAGADVTDPLVQTKIATQAYKDANAHIFQENNMVADFIKRGLSRFTQVNKETGRPSVPGKLAETAVKYELPVLRVPLNIIKRTFEYSFGVPTGAVRLALAIVKGLDKLPPEAADDILRNLSRGKVGLAAMAYGYFNPTQFGGYYQPGEKRAPGDLAAAHARVMGLDIPPYLVHNPLLSQFQIGSTIRRIVDSKATGKHPQSPGYIDAIVQAYAGVIEETPLVRSTEDSLKALRPSERDRFIGQVMQSTVPGVVEWAAKHWDTDANGDPISRKPTAPVEYFKQAVPGLRQDVPRRGQSAGQGSFYAPAPPPLPAAPPPPAPPPPLAGQPNRVLQPGAGTNPLIQWMKENALDPDAARLQRAVRPRINPDYVA